MDAKTVGFLSDPKPIEPPSFGWDDDDIKELPTSGTLLT